MKAQSYPEFIDRSYFQLLDGVRGMAILAVIWHHSGGQGSSLEFFSRGYLGVDLFFILSGFLITHLLIKEYRQSATVSLKNFYIRRTLRIFPLYYGYLAFYVFWQIARDSGQSLEALPYYLFYVSNWTPEVVPQFFERAWSLAVEEQFYLIWPLAFFLCRSNHAVIFAAFLVAVITLLNSIEFSGETWAFVVERLVPFRTLFFGCLLAIVLNYRKGFILLSGTFSSFWFRPLVAALIFLCLLLMKGEILAWRQLVIHLLMLLFLASCVVHESGFMSGFLRALIMKAFGKVSYGIYILHGQFWGATALVTGLLPLGLIGESRFVFFLVFSALSLIVALFSFHLYERHFLKLKKKFY